MTDLVLIANSGDGTINTLRLHRGDSPSLEVISTTGGLEGCGTFAVDRERDRVYAAYQGEQPGVAVLSLDRDSGRLSELSRTSVEDSMTYLELAHGGTLLLGVSYGGGLGLVWPVEDDALGEPTARTENANLHCVIARDGHAWFVSLGDDVVSQHSLSADGTLRPLDPPTVPMPDGSGPRHLVLTEDGATAYLVTEYSGELVRLTVGDDGTLHKHEAVSFVDPDQGLSHSRMDADPLEEHLIWGADVGIAGRYVLASERTSSLTTSVALGQDGELGEPVAHTPVPEQPRGFRVSDDGRYVVSVGERATVAALLEVREDGTLEQLHQAEIGNGANWVRFV